jgi:hypothetical protein
MYTLELTAPQLLMLKEMIENDMFMSEQDAPDYKNEETMMYYLDRCQVYHIIKEELET